MADENIEAQRHAELLAQANDQLQRNGKVSVDTQAAITDAAMKAKYGLDNFSKSMATGGAAIAALGDAAMAGVSAMAAGKKGAAAVNAEMDALAKATELAAVALTLLIPGGPIIKMVVGAIGALTVGFIRARNEFMKIGVGMSDALYKSYSGLAKSGAAAADGMTGVLKLSNQLRLSMDELDGLVQIVAEHSTDLALLGGSVAGGVKQLGAMGQALKGNRQEFLGLGLTMTEVSEGMANYLKIQTRSGRAQSMTTDQLASSARGYILEQDRLAQLTGLSAKKQQEVLDRAKENEQFNAKIRMLELEGTDESRAAADRLRQGLIHASAMGPDMEEAFMASVNGNLRNAAAQRANMTTQGQLMRSTQDLEAGFIDAAKFGATVARSGAEYEKSTGIYLSQLDAGAAVQLKTSTMANMAAYDRMNVEEKARFIAQEQEKRMKGTGDKMLKDRVAADDAAISANQSINQLVAESLPAVHKHMIFVAKASLEAAQSLQRLANIGEESAETREQKANVDEMKQKGLVNSGTTNDQGMDFSQLPGAAAGGVFKGPVSGFPVMLHGHEAVVPLDKAGKKVSELAQSGSSLNIKTNQDDAEAMMTYAKNMLDDTAVLAKITDTELVQSREYSKLQTTYFDQKSDLMSDEITLLRKQNEIIQKMVDAAEKASGPQAAAAMQRQLRTASAYAPAAPGMGGGTGVTAPKSASAPGMGGGTGVTANQDSLKNMGLNIKAGDVQAEGAGINSKLIELAQAVQSSVPGFKYFSAFNDKFHQEKAPGSQHAKGRAFDFTVAGNPSVEEGKGITDWLRQSGASLAIDEYNNPSSKATAGHFHAAIPEFETGGLAVGPDSGYSAKLHGTEAVIPMQNNSGDFVKMFETMAVQSSRMADMLETLVRAQRDGNDISTKILRQQA
jgi:hypothetical protein